MLYYRYSDFLKQKYGEKVYKLPIHLPCTCPNRDGRLSTGGCLFCGDVGTGFEMMDSSVSVAEQVQTNRERIGKAYGAKKFIAYFQNFTNTYLPTEQLEDYLTQALAEDVVQIAISTRPDCLSADCLSMLQRFQHERGVDISVELGMQTANYHTLRKLNRQHGLASLVDAFCRIRAAGLESGSHVILNLPWDDREDVVETAALLSALHVDTVKLHSLYILKESQLGRMYQRGDLSLISSEEYIERVILFLEHLDPSIAVQRLLARAPEGDSLFCNWGMSWWKLHDDIEKRMREEQRFQGRCFIPFEKGLLP